MFVHPEKGFQVLAKPARVRTMENMARHSCWRPPRGLQTGAAGAPSTCRVWASAHRGQWRERVLFADNQLLMLMGDVAFNVTLKQKSDQPTSNMPGDTTMMKTPPPWGRQLKKHRWQRMRNVGYTSLSHRPLGGPLNSISRENSPLRNSPQIEGLG